MLRPHPDHPHVVPDHVGVQGRVPVHHLTSPIALKAGHGPAFGEQAFCLCKVIEKFYSIKSVKNRFPN